MPEQRLRDTLAELQRELDGADSLDAESRDALRQIAEEIETRLEAAEPHEESVGDRLLEAAQSFEAEYPTLGASVRRVVNALSNLGI